MPKLEMAATKPETFDPIVSFEDLSKDTIRMVSQSLGPIVTMMLKLSDVDYLSGTGIVDKHTKCVWIKEGKRITFTGGFGGLIASISNGIDPNKPVVAAISGESHP